MAQTTGFSQGDNASPLFYLVVINDLPEEITSKHKFVRVILYADDLCITSRSRFHMQKAAVTPAAYVRKVGLTINAQKTEFMKFQRGGRLAGSDEIHLEGTPIKRVSCFTYLGITMTTTGTCFRLHIEERVRKAMFLKRALGVHRSAKNRLMNALAACTSFVEELRLRLHLEETETNREFISEREAKRSAIDPNFYDTPTMTNEEWKQPERTNRSVLTRFSIHGFHHVTCTTTIYHEPDPTLCTCKFCGMGCGRYHGTDCEHAPSLARLSGAPEPTT